MAIDLYYNQISSPCRAVLLAAKAIGVELNLKSFNLLEGEHLTPEFLKLNPQHTIPTINDNGFVLWESRAIITYLQNKYGKNDSLYPKDPKKRAVVDQKLYFGIDFHTRLHQVYNRETISGAKPDPEKLEQLKKSLEFLDSFLDKTEYIAGDNLTLADLALVVDVSDMEVFKYDISPYKNINRWLTKVKATAPGFQEISGDNLVVLFKQLIEKMTKK